MTSEQNHNTSRNETDKLRFDRWLQIIANLAQVLSLIVTIILALMSQANPALLTWGLVVMVAVLYAIAAAAFVYSHRRRCTKDPLWQPAALVAGGILLGAIAAAMLRQPYTSLPLGASLTGLKATVADWRSSLVDLRTVGDSGISIKVGDTLEISDVLAFVSEERLDYEVHLEMYADRDLATRIGTTVAVPMLAGARELGGVTTEGDNAVNKEQWVVPSGWLQSPLFAALIAQRRGNSETIVLEKMPIRLEPGGSSWFLDPPYGQIAAIAYTVNGAPPVFVDMPAALEQGIAAGPGDRLGLVGVWYRGVGDGKNIQIEANIENNGKFDDSTFLETLYEPMRGGLHPISNVTGLAWAMIPEGQRSLGLQLWREDNILLDSFALKLSGDQGAPGLLNPQAP